MRAVGFHHYGPAEVVEVVEVPAPRPSVGQVAVRVEAATVNPADVQYRRGDHAGFVPDPTPPQFGGLEFAGVVTEVGDGVDLAVGTRVAGTSHFIPDGRGCHAEVTVVDDSWVVPCPEGLTAVEAATIPMNGLTTRVVLDTLGLPVGSVVLVTGAAGAVGGMVTELGVREGLEVVAVASPSDEDELRAMGAAAFVPRGDDLADRVRGHWPDGVAAVVDGAMLDAAILPAVADGGQFITLRPGHVPAGERGIEPRIISFRRHQARPDVLAELMAQAAAGALTPRVAHVLPPDDGRRAHELVEAGGLRGRVVLDLG